MSHRIEHDPLGEERIPIEADYGIHTFRSLNTFNLAHRGVNRNWVHAVIEVKSACAQANLKAGYLEVPIANAIRAACQNLLEDFPSDLFLTDAFQGGAGTSLNMNVNEVIANRAIQILGGNRGDYSLVHPLDHVNLSQSTNDVIPTALKVAAIRQLRQACLAMADLQSALQTKEVEFSSVLKVGRTELQDALPMTLGQSFASFAQAVQRDWWRLMKAEERLRQVNLGGTALGTGLNADKNYIYSVVDQLNSITSLSLARAENLMDATSNLDVFVEVSGLLKAAATTLQKIASDLRLLSSGPHAGLGEIQLPPVQAGSSIMPGKVNPVIPEAVSQASYQVMAHDLAITLAASHGQLELNAFLPLLGDNLLISIGLISDAALLLATRCILGIKANAAHCETQLANSFVLVTALTPYIGYEAASELVKEASSNRVTLVELVKRKKLFSEEQLAKILTAKALTHPGIPGQNE